MAQFGLIVVPAAAERCRYCQGVGQHKIGCQWSSGDELVAAAEDTLARWLFERYHSWAGQPLSWDRLSDEQRQEWQREAVAVRQAVGGQ